jgi:hypothetical protein
MIEAHQGSVHLGGSFADAFNYLMKTGSCELKTAADTIFTASASGTRDGRQVIRFFQKKLEYGRTYSCCWGHYYNCNRTRIGMYCKALDISIS